MVFFGGDSKGTKAGNFGRGLGLRLEELQYWTGPSGFGFQVGGCSKASMLVRFTIVELDPLIHGGDRSERTSTCYAPFGSSLLCHTGFRVGTCGSWHQGLWPWGQGLKRIWAPEMGSIEILVHHSPKGPKHKYEVCTTFIFGIVIFVWGDSFYLSAWTI